MMKKTLSERRAIFVYEAARIENSCADRPINPEPWEDRDEKFRKNMVRAVAKQCGGNASSSVAELHERWIDAYKRMGWRYGKERDVKLKTHPDMVPYRKLGKKEQEKDWVFFMLCKIAKRIR